MRMDLRTHLLKGRGSSGLDRRDFVRHRLDQLLANDDRFGAVSGNLFEAS